MLDTVVLIVSLRVVFLSVLHRFLQVRKACTEALVEMSKAVGAEVSVVVVVTAAAVGGGDAAVVVGAAAAAVGVGGVGWC